MLRELLQVYERDKGRIDTGRSTNVYGYLVAGRKLRNALQERGVHVYVQSDWSAKLVASDHGIEDFYPSALAAYRAAVELLEGEGR